MEKSKIKIQPKTKQYIEIVKAYITGKLGGGNEIKIANNLPFIPLKFIGKNPAGAIIDYKSYYFIYPNEFENLLYYGDMTAILYKNTSNISNYSNDVTDRTINNINPAEFISKNSITLEVDIPNGLINLAEPMFIVCQILDIDLS